MGAFLIKTMKALKRFYGKSGRWYDVGHDVADEDIKGLPSGFVDMPEKKKAVKKTITKNGKPNTEDK